MARTSDMFGALTLYVTLLIFYPFLSNAQAKNHVALFIFGDSLYDTGMTLYNGVKGAGAEFWPYGETYFKKPAGRYSDGRIIPDFIAQFAGLPLPKPYLLPGLNDYTNGVNFASASACVLVGIRPQTINLKMQVDYFKKMVQKLKQQVGQKKAKNMLSKSVYLFNIGGNDYVSLLQKNVKKLPLSPSTKKLYMNQVLGNLTHHIKTIHNQGGRKFAFQNIGPLGCMPAEKNRLGSKGACALEPQKLAKMHNAAFLATVNKLASQLSGFKYSVYDSFASSSLRLQNGNKYGFKTLPMRSLSPPSCPDLLLPLCCPPQPPDLATTTHDKATTTTRSHHHHPRHEHHNHQIRAPTTHYHHKPTTTDNMTSTTTRSRHHKPTTTPKSHQHKSTTTHNHQISLPQAHHPE